MRPFWEGHVGAMIEPTEAELTNDEVLQLLVKLHAAPPDQYSIETIYGNDDELAGFFIVDTKPKSEENNPYQIFLKLDQIPLNEEALEILVKITEHTNKLEEKINRFLHTQTQKRDEYDLKTTELVSTLSEDEIRDREKVIEKINYLLEKMNNLLLRLNKIATAEESRVYLAILGKNTDGAIEVQHRVNDALGAFFLIEQEYKILVAEMQGKTPPGKPKPYR